MPMLRAMKVDLRAVDSSGFRSDLLWRLVLSMFMWARKPFVLQCSCSQSPMLMPNKSPLSGSFRIPVWSSRGPGGARGFPNPNQWGADCLVGIYGRPLRPPPG